MSDLSNASLNKKSVDSCFPDAPGFPPWLLLIKNSIPTKTDYAVIVIGAGMGGLSAAHHLTVKGQKVLVLEKHNVVGGSTSKFRRGDFVFDTALHEMVRRIPGHQ